MLSFQQQATDSDLKAKVIKAEVMHTNFIVQHNISFLTADHLAPLYAKMFPDSKIARNFKCSRTKTTCILNEAMRPALKTELVNHMIEHPFGLINDGSSDSGVKKMNAMCVHIFDVNRSKRVECKFYDMCVTTGEDCSKAYSLFDAINNSFISDDIGWDNAVSIGLDNTNSNMGNNNSLKSRILKKNPNCFVAGCNCHLSHLAASKGGKAFAEVSGFDVEDHQIDLYYFFKGSSRRKGILLEYSDFVGLEWESIIRYVKTRWLSLEKCCDKEIRKFPALRSMFLSRTHGGMEDDGRFGESGKVLIFLCILILGSLTVELFFAKLFVFLYLIEVYHNDKTAASRFNRLKKAYEDPLTEIYLSFFTSALPLFTHYNLFLQRYFCCFTDCF